MRYYYKYFCILRKAIVLFSKGIFSEQNKTDPVLNYISVILFIMVILPFFLSKFDDCNIFSVMIVPIKHRDCADNLCLSF